MTWKRAAYADVRERIKPGDVIAFGGTGHWPGTIKRVTGSPVSHAGVVLRTSRPLSPGSGAGIAHQIIESAYLDGVLGVSVSWFADRLRDYAGRVWWLPLSESTRDRLDLERFYDFLQEQVGRPYDLAQAVKSAVDAYDTSPRFGSLTRNVEDFSSFFCSELVAAGLEAGGAIKSLNVSEVTPVDLCRFALYQDAYYQLKGRKRLIVGFNTLDPEGWGEVPTGLQR